MTGRHDTEKRRKKGGETMNRKQAIKELCEELSTDQSINLVEGLQDIQELKRLEAERDCNELLAYFAGMARGRLTTRKGFRKDVK